jgi:hypothetical protein
MNNKNSVPFYYKLPSGRLIPFVSNPFRSFSKSELEALELIASIGFEKNGKPLK